MFRDPVQQLSCRSRASSEQPQLCRQLQTLPAQPFRLRAVWGIHGNKKPSSTLRQSAQTAATIKTSASEAITSQLKIAEAATTSVVSPKANMPTMQHTINIVATQSQDYPVVTCHSQLQCCIRRAMSRPPQCQLAQYRHRPPPGHFFQTQLLRSCIGIAPLSRLLGRDCFLTITCGR